MDVVISKEYLDRQFQNLEARIADLFHAHEVAAVERNRNLHRRITRLTLEVKTLSNQDTELTDSVTKLSEDFDAFKTELDAEIASLQGSASTDDPAVATAITNLSALSAKIEAATAAAAPAPVPDPPVVTDPPVDGTTV
jgi:chromosome segregation ATPase